VVLFPFPKGIIKKGGWGWNFSGFLFVFFWGDGALEPIAVGRLAVLRGGQAIRQQTLGERVDVCDVLEHLILRQTTSSVLLNPLFHVLVFRLGWVSGASVHNITVIHRILGGTRITLVREYIAIRALVARKLTNPTSLHTLSGNVEQFVVLVRQLYRVDAVACVVCHLACHCWHGFAESGCLNAVFRMLLPGWGAPDTYKSRVGFNFFYLFYLLEKGRCQKRI